MRPAHDQPATNLQALQQRLGGDLDALLGVTDTAATFDQPVVRATLTFTQMAGLCAGGHVAIDVGSYRIGPKPGSSALQSGTPEASHFGLTMDEQANVVVHPAGHVTIDGDTAREPTTISPGQVVVAGAACFRLESSAARRRDIGGQNVAVMPEPALGPGCDDAVVAWARRVRGAEEIARRDALFGPSQLQRLLQGGEFGSQPVLPIASHPSRVAVAFGDIDYSIPGDLEQLNEETAEVVQSLRRLRAVPLLVDFETQSLAVVGRGELTRSVASWLVLGAAAQSDPNEFGIRLHARGATSNDWPWLNFLPHTTGSAAEDPSLRIIDERNPGSVPETGVVVITETMSTVPDACSSVLEFTQRGVSLTDRTEGGTREGVIPIGVSTILATELASQVRDVHDPGAGS